MIIMIMMFVLLFVVPVPAVVLSMPDGVSVTSAGTSAGADSMRRPEPDAREGKGLAFVFGTRPG